MGPSRSKQSGSLNILTSASKCALHKTHTQLVPVFDELRIKHWKIRGPNLGIVLPSCRSSVWKPPPGGNHWGKPLGYQCHNRINQGQIVWNRYVPLTSRLQHHQVQPVYQVDDLSLGVKGGNNTGPPLKHHQGVHSFLG